MEDNRWRETQEELLAAMNKRVKEWVDSRGEDSISSLIHSALPQIKIPAGRDRRTPFSEHKPEEYTGIILSLNLARQIKDSDVLVGINKSIGDCESVNAAEGDMRWFFPIEFRREKYFISLWMNLPARMLALSLCSGKLQSQRISPNFSRIISDIREIRIDGGGFIIVESGNPVTGVTRIGKCGIHSVNERQLPGEYRSDLIRPGVLCACDMPHF